jgi:hypothetical protein
MPSKIKLALIIFSIIQFLIDLYIYKNWKNYVKSKKWSSSYYLSYLVLALIFLPLSIYSVNYNYHDPIKDFHQHIMLLLVNIWWLSKVPAFIFLLIRDIFKIFIKKKPEKKPELEKRRDFLISTGWTMAAFPYLLTTNGGLNTKSDLRVKKIEIPIYELPPNLHGTWIAQISDLHLGSFFDKSIMTRTIAKIKSLGANIVVLTGDFVNYDHREYEEYYKLMKGFKEIDNVYACLGNHDHYTHPNHLGELEDMIRRSGIDLLVNQSVIFEKNKARINISGIDNIGHGQKFGDFEEALLNADPNYKTIMLAHDPRNWDQSINGKLPIDLTLSGHTHGGQLVFEFMNERFSPVQFIYKQWAGLYSNKDQHIYVNTGIGTVGPPIRIGIPPEITLIRLVSAPNLA